MYGVIRQYEVDPSHADEITKRVREGFVPMISSVTGFVSYSIADAGSAGLLTISLFENQAGEEESVGLAARFVRDNLAELLPNPPRITSGLVTIRHTKGAWRSGFGVLRRYQFSPGDVQEITRRVKDGLAPIITGAPGFLSYAVIDTGTGEIVSLTAFEDRATAEASNQQALTWVNDNLSEFVFAPPEVITAQIKLRTEQAVAVSR